MCGSCVQILFRTACINIITTAWYYNSVSKTKSLSSKKQLNKNLYTIMCNNTSAWIFWIFSFPDCLGENMINIKVIHSSLFIRSDFLHERLFYTWEDMITIGMMMELKGIPLLPYVFEVSIWPATREDITLIFLPAIDWPQSSCLHLLFPV